MKSIYFLFCLGWLSSHLLYAQSFRYMDQSSTLPLANVASRSMDVASGDLDGDGDLDLVIAAEVDKNWILWNDGLGHFQVDSSRMFPQVKTYPQGWTGEDSEDIAIFDADNDEDLDLLFVTEDTDLHEFWLNDGTGHFSLAPYQFPHPNKSNAVLSYDFNQDQFVDILIGQNGQNILYLNQQDGSFAPDTTGIWPINTDWTQDFKMGDVNGDGLLDIMEGTDAGENNLYLQTGGVFSLQLDRLPADLDSLETRKVLLADVDLDQDLDIFLCNVGWNPQKKAQDALLINDGQGYFTEESQTRFPYFHLISLDGAFMHLNGDSLPDLLMVTGSEPLNHHVYLNDPNQPGHFLPGDSIFPFFVMNTTIALDTGDFNGDALTDVYFGVFQGLDRLFFQATPPSLPTGLRDRSSSPQMTVYPNPVDRWLTILTAEPTSATLFDIQGHALQTDLYISPGETLDVSHLAKGLYLLRLEKDATVIRFQKN